MRIHAGIATTRLYLGVRALLEEKQPSLRMSLPSDIAAMVALARDVFADPVTRAALPGLIADYQHDPEMYRRLLDRADSGARSAFIERLTPHLDSTKPDDAARRLDVAFDVLVGQTLLHALTFGDTGRAEFTDRTARALTAMLLSQSWA